MCNVLPLSSERSGSNLLRLMFDSHSKFSGPPAPQIARHLAPYIHIYGDLSLKKHLKLLVDDMLSLTQIHILPWNCNITSEEVLAKIPCYDFWSAYETVFSINAIKQNKNYWFNKENNLFDYAFEILHNLPKCKFIYLVRDGRDYACSMKESLHGYNHYYKIAHQWMDEQRQCLRIYSQLKSQGLIHLVHYEDLISDPENTLKRIMKFLDIDYEENMLNYHNASDVKDAASNVSYWKNLSKPIMPDNSQKFKKKMNMSDIRLFESIAGHELLLLQYELVNSSEKLHKVNSFQKLRYNVIDRFQRSIKRRILMNEPNRLVRSKHINSIKQRLQDRNNRII